MEELRDKSDLIDTLKRLIQNDKVLVRQMKRTIAIVDRNLRKTPGAGGKNQESDRDNH